MVLQVSNRPISNLPFELLNLILDYTIPPRLFLNPSFSLGPNSALSLTMRQMKSRVLVCKIWWDVHILAKQGMSLVLLGLFCGHETGSRTTSE